MIINSESNNSQTFIRYLLLLINHEQSINTKKKY